MTENSQGIWDGIRVRYLRDLQNRNHNDLENRDALHCHPASAIDGIVGGVPSNSVIIETSFGQLANAGAALTFSRGDHTHGTPAAPAPANTSTRIAFVNSPYGVLAADQKIFCDAIGGAIIVNLPSALLNDGRELTVKKLDVSLNTVTIVGFGAQTIDDSPNKVISIRYDSVSLGAEGGNWWII
jgi:hypothetical protein